MGGGDLNALATQQQLQHKKGIVRSARHTSRQKLNFFQSTQTLTHTSAHLHTHTYRHTHYYTFVLSVSCAEKRINCIFIFKHTSSAERVGVGGRDGTGSTRGIWLSCQNITKYKRSHSLTHTNTRVACLSVQVCVCLCVCVLTGVLLFSAMSLLLL